MNTDNRQYFEKLVMWDVMEEHLNEGGFLWSLWKDGLSSLNDTLDKLEANEETRFLSHIDALAVGGESVEKGFLLSVLDQGSRAESIVVAASALLCSETKDNSSLLIDKLACAQGALLEGLQSVLELAAPLSVEDRLLSLQASTSPLAQAAATEILSCRGFKLNPKLLGVFEDADSRLQTALLRAGRTKHGHCYRNLVDIAINSPDTGVRNAALETGLAAGKPAALDLCIDLIALEAADLSVPLELLGLFGGLTELGLLSRCVEKDAIRSDAIWALGFLGTIEAVEICLDLMARQESVSWAAEAFCFITGLNLEQEGLIAYDNPEDKDTEPVPLEDDDLDTEPVPDPVESLILPDTECVNKWWDANRGHFQRNRRYLLGRPVDPLALYNAFQLSSMRRRKGLCLQLVLLSNQGCMIVEPRALCRQQRQQQEAIRHLS